MAEEKKTMSKAEEARAARAKQDTVKKSEEKVVKTSDNSTKSDESGSNKKPMTLDQKKKIGFAVGGTSVLALSLTLGLVFGLKPKSYDIMFIADTGNTLDKSFNQQSWDAIKKFGSVTGQETSFINPGAEENIPKSYDTVFDSHGSKIVGLSGFKHDAPWAQYAHNNPDKQSILVDNSIFAFTKYKTTADGVGKNVSKDKSWKLEADEIVNPKFSEKTQSNTVDSDKLREALDKGWVELEEGEAFDNEGNPIPNSKFDTTNTLGLTFSAEEGTFATGIIAWMHAVIDTSTPTPVERADDKRKVSGFVGMPGATTLDFMAGYEHGLAYMNTIFEGAPAKYDNAAEVKRVDGRVQLVSPDLNIKNDINSVDKDGDKNYEVGIWASGSFDKGKGAEPSSVALETKEALSILPVAGPQAMDAIKVINDNYLVKNRGATIIGVDVDMSQKVKTGLQKYVLTSQLKKINTGVSEMLHVWGVNNNIPETETPYVTVEEYNKGGMSDIIGSEFEFVPSITGSAGKEAKKEDITFENAKVQATKRDVHNNGVSYVKEGEGHKDAFNLKKLYEVFQDTYKGQGGNLDPANFANLDLFITAAYNDAISSTSLAKDIAQIPGTINWMSPTFE